MLCSSLFCFVLFYLILSYFILFYFVLFCFFILFIYFILFYFILFYFICILYFVCWCCCNRSNMYHNTNRASDFFNFIGYTNGSDSYIWDKATQQKHITPLAFTKFAEFRCPLPVLSGQSVVRCAKFKHSCHGIHHWFCAVDLCDAMEPNLTWKRSVWVQKKLKSWNSFLLQARLSPDHIKLSMPQSMMADKDDGRVLPWIGLSTSALLLVLCRHCGCPTQKGGSGDERARLCSRDILHNLVDRFLSSSLKLRMLPGVQTYVSHTGSVVLAGGCVEVTLHKLQNGYVDLKELRDFCLGETSTAALQSFWHTLHVDSTSMKAMLCSCVILEFLFLDI